MLNNETAALKKRWNDLKEEEPRLRTKDIADRLSVSEAELVASACDGDRIVRLTEDWAGIFENLESLGSVMALTRNEAAVHEKTGIYRNVSFKGHAGLVLDEQIDLRVFHGRWGFAFAVPVENPRGTLLSLQFFDKEGQAAHKIYLKDPAGKSAYHQLVDRFRHEDQSPGIELTEEIKNEVNNPLEEIDAGAFLNEWSELKDTHDFYPMLRRYKLSRTDALALAKEKYAWKVDNNTTKSMLELASQQDVPIMVFVKNSGMIQIHSGPVKKIREMGNWLNVLDPGFNLHLRQDMIHSSWIVEKPTEDGTVTSVEIFDKEGEQIATFFGARKPGKPELEGWREITAELKKEGAEG
ncbi:hemin-degrading factor [Rhodohalobacter mucosus]|uniref:Hemin-degrading factor n=2 Tax=Rhodohalobacter mucosus TaxID=2079485 RepID=A0A316TTY4_9BACT|nr:hemin-degrading factor [Rhodohalobacter mucosus]